MGKITTALLVAAAFAFAGPVSAQIVNGLDGANPPTEAPVGTKAGASNSSQQAPGEAAATAAAQQNSRDAAAMQPTTDKTVIVTHHHHHHHTTSDMSDGTPAN